MNTRKTEVTYPKRKKLREVFIRESGEYAVRGERAWDTNTKYRLWLEDKILSEAKEQKALKADRRFVIFFAGALIFLSGLLTHLYISTIINRECKRGVFDLYRNRIRISRNKIIKNKRSK